MANQISFQSVYQTTTAQGQFSIGQVAVTPDGRAWTYVQASTGGLQKGGVAVPVAATGVDVVSSSTDSEGRKVYITKASAGWTVGAFAGGWGVVDDGTGVGQTFKIIDNNADTLTLAPETALTTALTTAGSSDITIFQPNTVVKALISVKVQNATGIAQVAFSASDYGWVLTKGVGVVVAGEVLVVGCDFVTGDDTAGEVVKGTTAKGEFDEQPLGRALVANAAADQGVLVWVDIA